jgi:hypothetical protein
MFQAHFVYASTLASAIFALLPFIPPWVVVIPSALQLFIQVGGFSPPALQLQCLYDREQYP